MIRHIFKYEWIKGMADGSLVISGLALVLLTGIAIDSGMRWYSFQTATLQKVHEAKNEQESTILTDVKEYEAKDSDTVKVMLNNPQHPVIIYASKRGYTWKPPSLFTIFCIGQSDLYPYYNLFTGVEDQILLTEEEIQNPMNLLIGKMDLAFVIIYVLPLIVIALSFNLLSGEKEAGTYNLIRNQGIRPRKYLLYKLWFRFVWIFSIFTLSTLLFTALRFPQILGWSTLLPFVAILCLTAIYILFWLSLVFLINAFGKNSEVNGLVLIGSWIFWVFLLPSVTGTIAENALPIPSRNLQVLENRNHYLNTDREEALQSYLKRFPELRPENTTKDYIQRLSWHPAFLAFQDSIFYLDGQYKNRVRQQLSGQQKWVTRTAFFSPALMMRLSLDFLSKNDFFHFASYHKNRDEYIQKWRKYLGKYSFLEQKLNTEKLKGIPEWIPDSKPLAKVPIKAYAIVLILLSFGLGLAANFKLK